MALDDKDKRKASMMLAGLVGASDEALKVFRERRAADSDIDIEHLARARDILEFVYAAIASTNKEPWQRVEKAWKLLEVDREPIADEESENSVPEAATKDADKGAADSEDAAKEDSAPAVDGGAPPEASDGPSRPPSLEAILSGEGVSAPAKDAPNAMDSPWVSPSKARARQPGPRTMQHAEVQQHARQLESALMAGRIAPDEIEGPNDKANVTLPVGALRAKDVMPFVKGQQAKPPASGVEEDSDQLGGTLSVDSNIDHMKFSLPFKGEEAPSPPPAQAVEAAPASDPSESAREAAGSEPSAARSEPRAARSEPRAARSEPNAPPPRPASFSDSEERTSLIVLDEHGEPATTDLPFESPQPGASAPQATDAVENTDLINLPAADPESVRVSEASQSTLKLKAVREARDKRFLPRHLREMSVETYAALCAECEVHAKWADEISRERYEVRHTEDRERLDRHFAARFQEEPALREAWHEAFARVRAWAKQNSGG